MKTFVVQKGAKRLSSIYLNALGYSTTWVGNIAGADKFGKIKKPAIQKLFVFREKSWLEFGSTEEIVETFESAKQHISDDDRYTDDIKKSLCKSIDNMLEKNIVEIIIKEK